ncbi:hypothetical protein PVAP13_7NG183800 [Panicum virgatum]|uniref:Uncharacterized protein n=1 Tax=Panicum virgatum TaxID=38727 RepID=A0A8T0Q8D7_PANVG|nr:hypothetical protein PVAP13_7NG183800 [Panicum virgatum]
MALDADQALRAAAEAAGGAGLGGGGAGTAVPWSSRDGDGASPLASGRWSSRDGDGASPLASGRWSSRDGDGVPPVVLWSGDDRRTKQELVAWARAVASMVVRDYSMRC